jgi:hypothetical protein
MAKARLSMVFQDVRGAIGHRVIVKTRSGLAVRRKPKYRYPKSPNVVAGNERFRLAAQAWSLLSVEQISAWRDYADSIRKTDPVTLQHYSPSAKNAFMGLACKFLQINPSEDPPLWPPVADFVGDNLVVYAEPVPGEGVRFTASSENSSGVATELLFQKLKNIRWRPTQFYKSLGFHSFETSTDEVLVPLEPGVYAFGWRFVDTATGQATPLQLIGTVVLGIEASEARAA